MKILILNRHNSSAVNGLKKIILSFIELCKNDKKQEFYYGMQQNGPLTNFVKDKNFIIPFNIKRNISIISDLHNILKLIFISYKYKIDVVHAHAAKPGMIARVASIFSPFKVIYTPNNWYFEGQTGFKRFVFLNLERILSFIPKQTIVAVTQTEKDMIISKINNKSKVKIIADGIDFSILNQSVEKDSDFRCIESKKQKKKIIGSIIRLDNQKNPLEILKYSKILSSKKNLHFVIIGDGSLKADCESYIIKNNLKNISLLGFKSNYSSFLKLFDYTLFTSENEGLPLVMIESIYNNKKIITKNFRGAKDFVVEDYGKILNGDSVQARAKDLYNYISNDLKILQINEKEFINKFSRESMISKYIQLYNSL